MRKQCYLAAPIRQMVVPQSGQVPLVIGLPFFVVLSTGFCISFFALHFTQYASIAMVVEPLCSFLWARGPSFIYDCIGRTRVYSSI